MYFKWKEEISNVHWCYIEFEGKPVVIGAVLHITEEILELYHSRGRRPKPYYQAELKFFAVYDSQAAYSKHKTLEEAQSHVQKRFLDFIADMRERVL